MNNLKKQEISAMIKASFDAQKNAYAPYSKFIVGASVLTKSGKIFCGANIENASYPAGICAERVAFAKAISEGETVSAVCITCNNDFAYPCGVCLQFMSEFGMDTAVVIAKNEDEYKVMSIRDLLPNAFESSSLNEHQS